MTSHTPRRAATCAVACLGLAVLVSAQALAQQPPALRDPTRMPHAPLPVRSGADHGPKEPDMAMAVLFADGKPFVMQGSRLYGVGDKMGAVRIERITESEVWLRDGKELRKVSLYPGVERLAQVPVKE